MLSHVLHSYQQRKGSVVSQQSFSDGSLHWQLARTELTVRDARWMVRGKNLTPISPTLGLF